MALDYKNTTGDIALGILSVVSAAYVLVATIWFTIKVIGWLF